MDRLERGGVATPQEAEKPVESLEDTPPTLLLLIRLFVSAITNSCGKSALVENTPLLL